MMSVCRSDNCMMDWVAVDVDVCRILRSCSRFICRDLGSKSVLISDVVYLSIDTMSIGVTV
jgi:hypothetical protein